MKKQYVLRATLRNGNVRYLTKVENRYPFKSADIEEAKTFTSKAAAWSEYRKIGESNIGYEAWEVVINVQ